MRKHLKIMSSVASDHHPLPFWGALHPVTVSILLALFVMRGAQAGDDVQFNTDVLDVKDRTSIDLSQFSKAGYLMPGKYQLTVRVNKSDLPDQQVEFFAPEDNPKGSEACLTPELVKQFGFKEDALKKTTWWHKGECLELHSLDGVTATPDLGSGVLYINVPQAYMEYTSETWDPPSRWDNGIPGMLFDYNVNAMTSKQKDQGHTRAVSGNGTTGVNAGPWRLRADWQAQYTQANGQNSSTQKNWDWSRYYAYRAITSLRAKLILGETSLDSAMFDSFQFRGASLNTDDNQLPSNLRGYAPEVVGVAKTNAKVTVSQQGRVIYETTVASGPFRIQDLNSAVTGKLDVKVEEQDGAVHTFQVDTASIPYLTRPGLVRYKFAAGKPSENDHHAQGPEFAASEFSWGINNGWSLYGGGLFAGDYNALSIGLGRDLLAFGAISIDVTQSQAKLPHEETLSGKSFRVSYSKRFDEYDSQVTFAGYRFSQREFMNMTEYLDKRYHENNSDGDDKELYTITMNKQFRSLNASAYLNYSHQTYWDRKPSDTWNLSVSNYFDVGSFKNVSLSLSAYRTQYENSNDDGMYLSLSVPWGNNGTLSYSGQSSGGKTSNTLGYYNRIDDNNNYRINAGTTSDGLGTGSGYYTHDGDLASMTANASFTGNDYSAAGLSLQGGMTATAQGAALHRTNTIGGTRMMVDTGGVSGVPVRTSGGGVSHANYFGKAVVSDISSYYHNSVNVDLDKLPENVDATRSVVEGTLTEGAIGYRKFGILAGEKSMAVVKLADGSSPPFGAEIRNLQGSQTGIIGEEGSVWLSGIRAGEQMKVSWNDGVQCRIDLPSPLPALGKGLLLPCTAL
ncbi:MULTISPECIES: outer membrane usher protein [unclassified Enterobacter]|uniref:outer membrane usher protein n=2 Tax=unclassified Enterobacter TaxID=2608935 RepID=UPI001CC128D4|nr:MULTISPECIES: outer membrane usher protein [unclassified Enterobacter]UXP24935.1 outer membrane usher protein [Enterobacter sp. 155105]